MKGWIFSAMALAAVAGPSHAAAAPEVRLWLESSLKRVFPGSPAGSSGEIAVPAARNRSVSFQACVRNSGTSRMRIECTVEAPPDLKVRVRRVGYVPMLHHTAAVELEEQDGVGHIPGLVPDPLFPEQVATVGPFENQSFWITVAVPAGVEPGLKNVKVRMAAMDDRPGAGSPLVLGEMNAVVDVRPFTVQARRGFPVTHWFHADALYGWYKIEPFGEKWFELAERYVRDMAEHGSNVIWIPLLHTRREDVSHPAQLLTVRVASPGRYEFDFSKVRRFVRMAKQCGMEYVEIPHFWLYGGSWNPVHVYTRNGSGWSLLWPDGENGHGEVFRGFLKQFLPALHQFLKEEDLLDRAFFHVSDEPGPASLERYKAARAILKEIAPWMKVMDALSHIGYGKAGLTDMPVPRIHAAPKFLKAGIPHWVYFCTDPRGKHLNRFFDTPLPKIRMSGWLFYRLKAQGFLHWAFHYWFKLNTQQLIDPFKEGAADDWPFIPYGDPFVVYPGPDGPIDSIRWEVFSESLQDYAMLQTAGISPDAELLREIQDYAEFPKSETWIQNALRQVLK